ncbi:MAG: hypothetical protein ACXABY_25390 [Candidatus Thorarchaeota archaeon]|jgi:hypothetical protein
MGNKTWTFDHVTVEMWHAGWKNGRNHLGYRLVDKEDIVFEGEDFRPSPLYAEGSEDVVMALLSFLTLQPGDTDDEYFQEYTQEQLDWCGGETAEELRMLWLDYEYAKEDAR